MSKASVVVLGIVIGFFPLAEPLASQTAADPPDQAVEAREADHPFTGELLPVFYVADVRRSVEFYHGLLGFHFFHYWNYEKNQPAPEWNRPEPPRYAEMAAGEQKFGLHLKKDPSTLAAKTLFYFRVKDVDAYRRQLVERGVEAEEMTDRPWMRFFSVIDPDGHKLLFYIPPVEEQALRD